MRAYTTLLTVVVLLAASAAHAVPMQLAHQGRLLDADGAPLDGEHTLSFALYDTEKDGAVVWSEDIDALMTGGFYSVVLGADEADNPLDDLVLGGGPLWLELRVDDGALSHQFLSLRPGMHTIRVAFTADRDLEKLAAIPLRAVSNPIEIEVKAPADSRPTR